MTSTDPDLAALRNATPGAAYQRWITGLARLRGRAGRWEYWTINLTFIIGSFVLSVALRDAGSGVIRSMEIATMAVTVLALWSVTVRRLHDMGQPGWWYGFTVVAGASYCLRVAHPDGWRALDPVLSATSIASLFVFVMTLIGPRESADRYGPKN